MNRRIARVGLSLAAAGCMITGIAVAQNLNRTPSSDVLASAFGSDGRTGTTLTNLIATYGTRECTIIIDGGKWDVTNNVTWPTNLAVLMTPNSYFEITNSIVMDFQSNTFGADHQVCFAGAGSATGFANFIYRYPVWGDVGDFRIGNGVMGTNVWDSNFTMDDGTTFTAKNLVAGTGNFYHIESDTFDLGTGTVDYALGGTVDVHLVDTDRLIVNTTNFVVNGFDMAPQEAITLGFSNDMSTAEIQEKIDSVRKLITYPNTVFLHFSNGVYNLTSRLYVDGFYGAGTLYVQGDLAESGTRETERNAWLDFSSGNRPGIEARDSDIQVVVRNLKITCKTDNLAAGIPYALVAFDRVQYGGVWSCALWGTSTNIGDGIRAQNGSQVSSISNTFVSVKHGMRGLVNSTITDKGSISAVTNPTHGVYMTAAQCYRRDTVVTGAVSNAETDGGGAASGP